MMTMFTSCTATALAFSVIIGFFDPVGARLDGSTRGRRPLVAASWKHAADVKKSLLDVLHDGSGSGSRIVTEIRIDSLEEALRPMFTALPKNKYGRLEHATVHYALHRFFAQQHGMYLKGLEPSSATANTSSPFDILEDRVPAYVQSLFEERLHDGFDVHELAMLAGTLEHIIHAEAGDRLKVAHSLNGFSPEDGMTMSQLERVIDTYMVITLYGRNASTFTSDKLERRLNSVAEYFPSWPENQRFTREIKSEVLDSLGGTNLNSSSITLATAMQIVDVITQRYGRWQDSDCRSLAKQMATKEYKGTGRVKLSDFYQLGSEFSESKEYLRLLGALEETTKQEPRVVIPNYVNSASNCLTTSALYSVCCIDQCQELLNQLERSIAAPTAMPERILEVVSGLPSGTVQAPRHLHISLVKRLDEIAAMNVNGGRVPLFGKLFAQWMHHAYPRECPNPHRSGTVKPMTADEWLQDTNDHRVIPQDQIAQFIREQKEWESQATVKDLADGDLDDTMPWIAQEELVAHHAPPTLTHELSVLFRAIVSIGGFFFVVMNLANIARSGMGSLTGKLMK